LHNFSKEQCGAAAVIYLKSASDFAAQGQVNCKPKTKKLNQTLSQNLCHYTSANGTATFADCET
jgi:hypothetical protein